MVGDLPKRNDMAEKDVKAQVQESGELVIYRLNQLDDKLSSVLVKIDNSLATKAYVDAKYEELDRRIKPFEEARKWLILTVGGVLILALLGLVVRGQG